MCLHSLLTFINDPCRLSNENQWPSAKSRVVLTESRPCSHVGSMHRILTVHSTHSVREIVITAATQSDVIRLTRCMRWGSHGTTTSRLLHWQINLLLLKCIHTARENVQLRTADSCTKLHLSIACLTYVIKLSMDVMCFDDAFVTS